MPLNMGQGNVFADFVHSQAERTLGLWFPIVLFFAGLVTRIFSWNATFVIGLGAGTAAGIGALYLILFRQSGVRLSWVMATGLLLGYAGGAVNTDVGLMQDGTNLANYVGRLQTDLSAAAAVVLWVTGALFFFGGMFEPPLSVRMKALSQSDLRLVWVGIALVAFCFAKGYLIFDGTQLSRDHHVSVLGDMGSVLCGIMPAMTIMLFAASRWRQRIPALLLLILIECCFLIMQSRRSLIYGLVIAALAASFAGMKIHASPVKKAVLVITAGATIYVGMHFFYTMRVVQRRLGGPGGVSTTRLIGSSFAAMVDTGDTSISEELSRNVRDRTSIITYLSDLLAASKSYSPLYGEDALYCVKFAIPSAFYRNKADILFSEETLTNPRFGLVIEDDANSIMTTGASDFGLFGCCAYPIIVVVIFRLYLGLLQRHFAESAYVVALLAIVTMFIQTETGGPAYTTLGRDTLLLAILITVAKKWPALRQERPGGNRSALVLPAGGGAAISAKS